MLQNTDGENRQTDAVNALSFRSSKSAADAEACLASLFGVSTEAVRTTFQDIFEKLAEDGHVVFFENLEGVQRPDKFPSRPFDMVGYDRSGKAVFRVVISFPLLKGDFCSVLKTSNVKFFELAAAHRRQVLEIREKLDRLFRAVA